MSAVIAPVTMGVSAASPITKGATTARRASRPLTTFGLMRGLPMDVSDLACSHANAVEDDCGWTSSDSLASAADTDVAAPPEEEKDLRTFAFAASSSSLLSDARTVLDDVASVASLPDLCDEIGDELGEALPCSSSFVPCAPPPPPLRLASLPSRSKLERAGGAPALALRHGATRARTCFDAAAVPLGDATALAKSLSAGRSAARTSSYTVEDLRSRCQAARALTTVL